MNPESVSVEKPLTLIVRADGGVGNTSVRLKHLVVVVVFSNN